VRFPRAGLSAPLPGGSGPKRPAGNTTGLRVIPPAALGRQGAGNTRSYLVPSQEARELELSGGVRSRPQEPWWNAGRRARPIAEGRRKPPYPWRDPRAACVRDMKQCDCRRSASLISSLRRVGEAKRNLPWLEERRCVSLSLYPSYRSVPGLRSASSGLQDTGRSTPLFETRGYIALREWDCFSHLAPRAGRGRAKRGCGGLSAIVSAADQARSL